MADACDVVSKIIDCVKQFPALYDTTHEDYNRYYKKIQIWNNIAAEVNYSDGKLAQTKWRNIRDSYVKHLKSLKTLEPAYKKYRNWHWVEQMSFLKKFLGGNKQKQNVKGEDHQEMSIIEAVESVYGEPSVNATESENFESSPAAPQKCNGDPASSLWSNENEIVENVTADCDFTSYSTNTYLDHVPIDPSMADAIDLLFLSYAKTIKGLSKKRQIQVKMKISEIIGQAELDDENGKQDTESNHVDSSGGNEVAPKPKKRKH